MRLKTVAIRGLKNLDDFSLEIAPLTALMGPNGSGKTAILQAVRLVLLGYDPETGKQLKDTRKLISELREAEVSLSFDSDFGVRRRFGRSTATEVFPSDGETTEKACQDRINRETGGLVVALDLAEFIGKSDEKRREWLFEHLPRGLAALDWDTFSEWTNAEAQDALTDLRQDLWENVVRSAASPVDGISAAVSLVHQNFLEADQARKDQGKVVAEAEKEAGTADETASAFDAERLESLQGDLADVNQRIGEARKEEEEIGRAQKQLDGLRREAHELDNQIAEMEATHNRLNRELEESRNGGLAKKNSALTRRLVELRPKVTEASTKADGAGREMAEAKARVRSDELTLADTRRKLEEVRSLGEEGSCRACGQPLGESWTQSVACAEEDVASARQALEKAETSLVEATSNADAAERTGTDLHREEQGIHQDLQAIENEVGSQNVLMERLEDLASVMARTASRRDEVKKALQGPWPNSRSDLEDTLRALYIERESSETAIRSMEAHREAEIRAMVERERVGKERDKLKAKEARATALKELYTNLQGLRGQIIRQMIAPLHEEADAVLRSVDPHKRWRFVFERENREILDFGFEQDGQVRLFDAASNGEKALLAVAFIAALLAVLDPPLKLLVIDNLEALDAVRRVRLLETLRDLHAEGRWDNVLVAGACDLTTVSGWTVADMDAEPVAVRLVA